MYMFPSVSGPKGRKGTELQQRHHPLPLFAHLHYGYHHAMLPP